MIENETTTHARSDDGTETVWSVRTGDRATSMMILRGTSEGVRVAQAVAPSAHEFTDVTTGTILGDVRSHGPVVEDDPWAKDCAILGGRCSEDTYFGLVARPLFHAAAAAAFDDAAVFALLAELHAKAGAR